MTHPAPWHREYGPEVDPHFRPMPLSGLAELVEEASRRYAGHTAYSICLPNGMTASLDYAEVNELADRFAAYLRHELGLPAGTRVGIQLPNSLSYPIAAFGVFKAGCTLVNINPLYTPREMNHQLMDSGAQALIIVDMFADKLAEALPGTAVREVITVSVANFYPLLKRSLIRGVLRLKGQLPRPPGRTTDFMLALELGRQQLSRQRLDHGHHPEQLAVLQYTGGTTGVAKGAELTHANLLANIAQIDAVVGTVVRRGEDVVLTALPLYHIFAFTFNMLFFYRAGCHNVLSPSPRPVANLRPIFEKFPITKTTGVNTLFKGLLDADWFRANPPRSLDLTISGGTALHTTVGEQWRQLVGSAVLEGYGLSETSPVLCVNPPLGENRPGTIGIPLPGTEVRLVDLEGREVAPGEPGELIARGPQVMRGYANRPDDTATVLKDGWFYTGDIATIDERGYVRIVDRKKDMIDVSGFNVFPNEVEDVLGAHPGVAEVAVIGVRTVQGEQVRAYVVKADPLLTAEQLIGFARRELTGYKVPKQVVFRQELPKSPVGKILRKELKQEAQAQGL